MSPAQDAGELAVVGTSIPGLLEVTLPVHADSRGWFKENWQREKMVSLGLPDFEPVQNNVSFNAAVGTTRGFHAEPWDKFVAVATGRIFGAWVDLREGPTFGASHTVELDPGTAVFVPRGVANAYQTLEPDTAYSYLVNDHWSPAARERYTFLNLADETVGVAWPLPLATAEVSEADRDHPRLGEVRPMPSRRPLVVGCRGQLGRALLDLMPGALGVSRDELDVTDPVAVAAWDWSEHDVVVNAAAFTRVDDAETPAGREAAWAANATAVALLAEQARRHRFTLVHVSTDYVFDGTRAPYGEDAPLSPLGVYGQSKAAGEVAATGAPRHYVLRTSWVVGRGGNFVSTMADLADRGVSPRVVDDQRGRLTFTDDLAAAAVHLVTTGAPYGTYHVTNGGKTTSWHEVAREVFRLRGRDPDVVSPVSTQEYAAGKGLAPRPGDSELDLTKLAATGFVPRDAFEALADYLHHAEDR